MSGNVVGRDGSNSPTSHFCGVNLTFKPPSLKRLQPGDSMPVILVAIRQVSHTKIFLRLGQLESFRSELFCPRWTQGGHHLNSAIREFFGTGTRAPMGSPRIESRDERMKQQTRHKNILNSKSLKIAVGEIHSLVPGQRELRWSNSAPPPCKKTLP